MANMDDSDDLIKAPCASTSLPPALPAARRAPLNTRIHGWSNVRGCKFRVFSGKKNSKRPSG
jgi:hypothetical protein